ncbi:MAG: hypothetical protein IPP29_12750 [Bacteroidetes bacterium]|nr:hypothetical protein [Bacteroidota bacterium]
MCKSCARRLVSQQCRRTVYTTYLPRTCSIQIGR